MIDWNSFSADELLTEVAYRTTDGTVDFSRKEHCDLFRQVLIDNGLNEDFVTEVINDVHSYAKSKVEEGSKATQDAHKKGLESVGFGRWKKEGDKQNKVVAMTDKKQDRLVMLSPEKSAKMTKKHQQQVKAKGQKGAVAKKPTTAKKPVQKKGPNIFEPGSNVEFKNLGRIAGKADELKSIISKIAFANKKDETIVNKFVGLLRDGDLSTLKKHPKTINSYIRLSSKGDDKLYIATKKPNQFVQFKRGKLEGIGKELQRAFKAYGMKTTASVTVGGKESLIGSKMLSPSQVFANTETVSVEKSENHLSMDGHEKHKLKEPSFGSLVETALVEIYKKRGSENPHRDAQFAMRAIRKHNTLLKVLSSRLDENTKFISPLPGVKPDSQENRNKIADAALDSLSKRIVGIFGKRITPGVKDILNDMSNLKASSNFTDDALVLLTKVGKSNDLKRGLADMAEIFTYVRRMKNGQTVYMPAQSNFPLADIFSLSPLELTSESGPEDIVKSIQSVFVSIDYRSIKKGAGGAATIVDKIDMSVFKSNDTRKILKQLSNTNEMIWNNKDVDGAYKIAMSIAKKLNYNTDSALNDESNKVTMGKIIKRLSATIPDANLHKKQLVVYNLIGRMIQDIYNKDVDIQLFSNERYKESVVKMGLSITDGVHSISDLNFVLDGGKFNSKSGKPETKYASRFKKRDVKL